MQVDELGRASSPGRVTLLGEHTDYNAGRALAVATTQRTTVTALSGPRGVVEVVSEELGAATTTLAAPSGPPFVRIAAALAIAASAPGVRLSVSSDLPIGAGLSSSAAYAVAVALALALGVAGDPLSVAAACQAAECAAGSDVGLLDQLTVLLATSGSAIDLDFSGPSWTSIALPDAVGLSVVDSGERRTIAGSAYRTRREECEAAARVLGPLGRASPAALASVEDPLLRRRARHVVFECERVQAGREALLRADLAGFGDLVDASHASLRDDFDASTPAVEAARDQLRGMRGVVGVRLTGAGFGGALLVVHDPAVTVALAGHWSSPLVAGAGAEVSQTPTAR
jgi:galactokinase